MVPLAHICQELGNLLHILPGKIRIIGAADNIVVHLVLLTVAKEGIILPVIACIIQMEDNLGLWTYLPDSSGSCIKEPGQLRPIICGGLAIREQHAALDLIAQGYIFRSGALCIQLLQHILGILIYLLLQDSHSLLVRLALNQGLPGLRNILDGTVGPIVAVMEGKLQGHALVPGSSGQLQAGGFIEICLRTVVAAIPPALARIVVVADAGKVEALLCQYL